MTFRTRFKYGDNSPYHYHSDQPSLTDARYARDTDLTRIVGIDGGQLYIKDQQAFMNAVDPRDYSDGFQDVSDIADFATIQRTMKAAEYHFMDLPSAVRAKYDNDLGKFLTALNEPVNIVNGDNVTHTSEITAPEVTPASEAAEVKN